MEVTYSYSTVEEVKINELFKEWAMTEYPDKFWTVNYNERDREKGIERVGERRFEEDLWKNREQWRLRAKSRKIIRVFQIHHDSIKVLYT